MLPYPFSRRGGVDHCDDTSQYPRVNRNIGDADRVGRLLAGATTSFLWVRLSIHSPWWVLMGIAGLYLLATALFGWGPFYALFRYSTSGPTDAQSTVKKVE